MVEMLTDEVLTANEWASLAELVDVLFPPGDDGVGAVSAGVLDYIGGVLARESTLIHPYRSGIEWLHERARAFGKERFDDLAATEREQIVDETMAYLEAGDSFSAVGDLDGPGGRTLFGFEISFMGMVWRHAREGLFGDPRHGGNRDGMIWQWLGYSGPQLHGYTDSEILANETPKRPLRFADYWKNHRER